MSKPYAEYTTGESFIRNGVTYTKAADGSWIITIPTKASEKSREESYLENGQWVTYPNGREDRDELEHQRIEREDRNKREAIEREKQVEEDEKGVSAFDKFLRFFRVDVPANHYEGFHNKVDGVDNCTAKSAQQAFDNCYYEWWTKEQADALVVQWKKKHASKTRKDFFELLNANNDYPWRAVNADLGMAPLPEDKSAATDMYYELQMPYSALVYEWYCIKGNALAGLAQKTQLNERYSTVKSMDVGIDIAKRNFKNNPILPSDGTMNKIYAAVIVFLVVAGIGGSASLVHELRK